MNDDVPDNHGDMAPINGGVDETPGLMIGAQYIKDLSFENPQGPEFLASLQETPQVSIEVHTNARSLGSSAHEVTLLIRGEAETDGKTVFIVELTYGGIITVNVADPEIIKPLLLIEAPRHLFPFARAIVANITRDGGFPPLLIDPLDFAGMYIEQHGIPEGAEDLYQPS